jgi:hypothetical protein
MYQIQKPEKYYIYNCKKQAYVFIADNWNELIAHIAQFNYHPWYSDKKMCNRFLESFNCTMNDTRVYCDWSSEYSDLREYIVFDADFRTIDMRMFEKEILAYKRPKNYKHKYKNKALEYKYEKTKPEFRGGPVPGTSKRSGHYGSYRHPHTLNEMRQNCDVEHQQYVRKRRSDLPTAWDDIFRDTPRSWKDQSKKRKQWM